MSATTSVEKRLETLEQRLETMEHLLQERLPSEEKGKRGWQAIIGIFADDSLYDEAMRLGQEWRESQTDEASRETSS